VQTVYGFIFISNKCTVYSYIRLNFYKLHGPVIELDCVLLIQLTGHGHI